MYCPKCGTQNIDTARFCRSCGASNLNAVNQALAGGSTEPVLTKVEEELRSKNIEAAFTSIFMGIAFFVVAAVFWRRGWGIWMLFPAFGLIGRGIARAVSLRTSQTYAPHLAPPSAAQENRIQSVQSRTTGELPQEPPKMMMPPPSVTEGTTRNLDPIPRQRDKA